MTIKYIVQNGIPVINPAWQAEQAQQQATQGINPPPPPYSAPTVPQRPLFTANGSPLPSAPPLAIVSTMEDQMDMFAATKLPMPQQIQSTVMQVQSDAYVQSFKARDANGNCTVDGGNLIEGLTKIFGRYEIPLGLMSKLTEFKGAHLFFTIDDSGTMDNNSNLTLQDASPYMQRFMQTYFPGQQILTRWQEAEDRLHTMIELLAYVPTGTITLKTFDHPDHAGVRVILEHAGKTPEAFLAEAHTKIRNLFSRSPGGGTPIYNNMVSSLNEANALRGRTDIKTLHYLLTDGEPTGGAEEIRLIKNLLISAARNPACNPFTFLGCSNIWKDYEWMHELEEISTYVAVLPDYKDEVTEVRSTQGTAFPYSRGFWLLCNIAAAINPNDLDGMDQGEPFTKATFESLMGRGMTVEEYTRYFSCHPNGPEVFQPDLQQFLTTALATDIASVRLYKNTLAQGLNRDIDNDDDDSELREIRNAQQAVIASRRGYGGGYDASQPVYGNQGYQGTFLTSNSRQMQQQQQQTVYMQPANQYQRRY